MVMAAVDGSSLKQTQSKSGGVVWSLETIWRSVHRNPVSYRNDSTINTGKCIIRPHRS